VRIVEELMEIWPNEVCDSNILCQRKILLSDSVNPKRRLRRKVKDVGAEYDLMSYSRNMIIM